MFIFVGLRLMMADAKAAATEAETQQLIAEMLAAGLKAVEVDLKLKVEEQEVEPEAEVSLIIAPKRPRYSSKLKPKGKRRRQKTICGLKVW